MPGLNYEEMKVVSQAYNEAFSHVMFALDQGSQQKISDISAEVIVSHKPYLMLSAEGIELARRYMKDKLFSDFIYMLWFVFAARWTSSDESISALAENLARGCTQHSKATAKLKLLPSDYSDRMISLEEAKPLLAANPWLMMMMMFPLSIKLNTGIGKRQQQQQN